MKHTGKCMELENFLLSEVTKTEGDHLHVFSHGRIPVVMCLCCSSVWKGRETKPQEAAEGPGG